MAGGGRRGRSSYGSSKGSKLVIRRSKGSKLPGCNFHSRIYDLASRGLYCIETTPLTSPAKGYCKSHPPPALNAITLPLTPTRLFTQTPSLTLHFPFPSVHVCCDCPGTILSHLQEAAFFHSGVVALKKALVQWAVPPLACYNTTAVSSWVPSGQQLCFSRGDAYFFVLLLLLFSILLWKWHHISVQLIDIQYIEVYLLFFFSHFSFIFSTRSDTVNKNRNTVYIYNALFTINIWIIWSITCQKDSL